MERTVQTRSFQDPLEGSFEKLFPWTFIFSDMDENAPVRVMADDKSGREITLPIGVILEMAEVLQAHQPAA